MDNEQLSQALTNEAKIWAAASDHCHLQELWEKRICQDTHNLTDQQARATNIAQACAFALATQFIAMGMMAEVAAMARTYSVIKTTQAKTPPNP